MRRVAALLLLVGVPSVSTACAKSSRDDARAEFVQQMVDEGGLDPVIAQCVADRFFDARTDEALKEFFEREELTEPEVAEFQRLGQECLDEVGVAVTTT